jgi:hypothetical protein
MFQSDSEIFSFVKTHLYAAAVCDILDDLGYHQAMYRLRPLLPDPKTAARSARTARWMETDYVVEEIPMESKSS